MVPGITNVGSSDAVPGKTPTLSLNLNDKAVAAIVSNRELQFRLSVFRSGQPFTDNDDSYVVQVCHCLY